MSVSWSIRGLQNRAASALYDAQQDAIRLAEEEDRIKEQRLDAHRLITVLLFAQETIEKIAAVEGLDADLDESQREALGLNLDALYLT